jgi:pimeloyl-ACP methyl ester carboxylesterase
MAALNLRLAFSHDDREQLGKVVAIFMRGCIAAVCEQIEGPVVAVGHSYGGAVISSAAIDAKNVVGLVFVAAFAPDEGETLAAAEAESKDSVLNSALLPRQYPTADGGTATELYIDRQTCAMPSQATSRSSRPR